MNEERKNKLLRIVNSCQNELHVISCLRLLELQYQRYEDVDLYLELRSALDTRCEFINVSVPAMNAGILLKSIQ